jgi:AMP-polyphosphate phosphotransferase
MQKYRYEGEIESGKHYDEIVERDRAKLLTAQFGLIDRGTPIIILVSGMINEWMDTRFIETHVHRPPSDEEADRPYFWKYWRRLPGHGETGLYLGSWYTQPWLDRLDGNINRKVWDDRINDILRFEEMLAADGTLIVKIRLELTEKQQAKRIRQSKNRPAYSWRMAEDDVDSARSFEERTELVTGMMQATDRPHAPWYRIDASNVRRRNLSVMHLLTECFEASLERGGPDMSGAEKTNDFPPSRDHLGELDLSRGLSRQEYTDLMKKYRSKIFKDAWITHGKKKTLLCLFEGADAAGKGGSIRRLIRALDARLFRVIQIAAPKGREKNTHYLHRFWNRIPAAGFVKIYDRSWYGRVLVERVEGYATETEWKRAYAEINQFEKELTDAGITVLKFWLEISDDEQLRRFRAREITEHKKFKITDEDWRNREKRDAYHTAVNDMVERTSTDYAPWHLIASEDKKFGRIEVMRLVHEALKKMK